MAIFDHSPELDALFNPQVIGPDWIAQFRTAAVTAEGCAVRTRVPSGLIYVSDNGGDTADLAAAEIISRLSGIRRLILKHGIPFDGTYEYCDIPSQDWRAGAFDLAQLKNDSIDPAGQIITLNCAPRLRQRGREGNNKGEPLYIGIDAHGTIIMATSPHSFGFLRDELASGGLRVCETRLDTGGSQFRSRDIFPWVSMLVTALAQFMPHKELFEALNFIDRNAQLTASDVPDLTATAEAVRIDVHGNIKLSKRFDAFLAAFSDYHGELYAVLNNRALKCHIKDKSFDSADGNTGISNGSSGKWLSHGLERNGFAELFTVGGRAADTLKMTSESMRLGGVAKGRRQIELHLVRADLLEQFARQNGDDRSYEMIAVDVVQEGLVTGFDNQALLARVGA